MTRTSFALLVSPFLAWGCADQPVATAQSELDSFMIGEAIGAVVGTKGFPEATTRERLLALGEAEMDLYDIVKVSETWGDVDVAVQAEMQQASEIDKWAMGQVAGLVMFRGHLLRGNATEEKGEAARYYLPFIAQSENPQVDVIADALELYPDEWSPEDRARIAADAAAVGGDYVFRKTGCDDCRTMTEAMTREQRETLVGDPSLQKDVLVRQVATSVERLEAIAAE